MPYVVLDPTTAKAAPLVTLGAPLIETGWTLSQYQEELTADLAQRTEVIQDIGWINLRIRDAYWHTASMLTTSQLFASFPITLDINQPFYLLPPEVVYIRDIGIQDTVNYSLTGGRLFEKMDEKQYRKLDDYTDEPYKWMRTQQNMLVLWPTPKVSRTIVVDVRIRPRPLVNAQDSPILPVELHEAISLAAYWRALKKLKDHTNAAIALNDYLTVLRPVLDADAEERAKQGSRLQPARSYGGYYRRRS